MSDLTTFQFIIELCIMNIEKFIFKEILIFCQMSVCECVAKFYVHSSSKTNENIKRNYIFRYFTLRSRADWILVEIRTKLGWKM